MLPLLYGRSIVAPKRPNPLGVLAWLGKWLLVVTNWHSKADPWGCWLLVEPNLEADCSTSSEIRNFVNAAVDCQLEHGMEKELKSFTPTLRLVTFHQDQRLLPEQSYKLVIDQCLLPWSRIGPKGSSAR